VAKVRVMVREMFVAKSHSRKWGRKEAGQGHSPRERQAKIMKARIHPTRLGPAGES